MKFSVFSHDAATKSGHGAMERNVKGRLSVMGGSSASGCLAGDATEASGRGWGWKGRAKEREGLSPN